MANSPNTWDELGIDFMSNGSAAASTTLSLASTTTATAVPGMTVNVNKGGVYTFEIFLHGTAAASGGINVTVGGTAVMSQVNISTWNYNGATLNALTNITAFSSSLTNNSAAYTDIQAQGTITCSQSGTLIIQCAQNTSNGTATTVVPGSYVQLTRIA